MDFPQTTKEVRIPSDWLTSMDDRIRLTEELMGGTYALRQAGESRLPAWPQEEGDDHTDRIDQAVLFNQFKKVVKHLAGKIFAEPIRVVNSADEDRTDFWIHQNIDNTGRGLQKFARQLLEGAIATGKHHSLTEMTAPRRNEDGEIVRPSAKDEAPDGPVRPYLMDIAFGGVIGWRQKVIDGKMTLTQIRILEKIEEEKGDFGTETTEQVRVYALDHEGDGLVHWATYRKEGRATVTWTLQDSGPTTLDYIPIHALMTGESDGLLRAVPMLEDLAWLNIAHYQSYSDQANILHTVRVPVWVGAGVAENEDDFTALGSGLALFFRDPGASFRLSETNGKAIEVGWEHLTKLEAHMAVLGMEPLAKEAVQQTGKEKDIDRAEAQSPLQAIADDLEKLLNDSFRDMERYAGLAEGSLGMAEVHKEFGISNDEMELLKILQAHNFAGKLSDQTFFEALQSMDAPGITEEWSWEEEADRLMEEATARIDFAEETGLGMGNEVDEDEDDDEEDEDDGGEA